MIKSDKKYQSGYTIYKNNHIYIVMIMIVLLLSYLLLTINNDYHLSEITRALLGNENSDAYFAVYKIRLPRLLAGSLVGLAFGIAGNTFQRVLNNPLASPEIIGVSSGASLGAVFCILVLNVSGILVSLLALIMGLGVCVLIYLLASVNRFSISRLILIGIGIQAMISSIISFILLHANQFEVAQAMRWLSGSLNGIQLKNISLLLIVVVVFTIIICTMQKKLLILELGNDIATSLGLKVLRTQVILLISAVFLVAFATATTGPISFIAFLAGPISMTLLKDNQANSIAAGLVGVILVLIADLIAQYAFSTRFPVGIITGFMGAPYLIYSLIIMNKQGGKA